MKVRLSFVTILLTLSCGLKAQQMWWVMLTDKEGSAFDPYAYFDAKAIERYRQNGFDLYDQSNRPLRDDYRQAINALVDSTFGESRWLNAMAVYATSEQVERLRHQPFVREVRSIKEYAVSAAVASAEGMTTTVGGPLSSKLADQLVRMQGDQFVSRGFDGKGVRIAVFDGGFPQVDSHKAFRHLHSNRQIVKTWNFPNGKEDVYGWNSHGTMTLSCIAGMMDGQKLGLATGSEFLLARTEVEMEPRREEVWWMQAMEWADRNGADIISSSLGYGIDRYDPSDMDGTSLVALVANMAARRGILVCNSAGNEGNDGAWMTIITPADADSVLCVGGIEAQLSYTRHIDFSSYGPSADGRLKPNVCAFGHALTANIGSDDATHWVDGTSFSCPLVAGFAACAWQTMRDKNASELFHAIEQSADLYPYYDYALGYGVPQASFFFGQKISTRPTFHFERGTDELKVVADRRVSETQLFYHQRFNTSGRLFWYESKQIQYADSGSVLLLFDVDRLKANNTIAVSLGGYYDEYRIDDGQGSVLSLGVGATSSSGTSLYDGQHMYKKPSLWGNASTYRYDIYWQIGSAINTTSSETTLRGFSPSNHLGVRFMRAFSKPYGLGIGLDWSMTNFRMIPSRPNALDNALAINVGDVRNKKMRQGDLALELFQRIRFVAGGIGHRGLYCDMGLYAAYSYYRYDVSSRIALAAAGTTETHFRQLHFSDAYLWNWGATLRFGYDFFSLFARYRLTGVFSDEKTVASPSSTDFYLHLPRLEVGLQIAY
ncbi:MAG: S8 family serine peptidase [Bacteroidales bacterium]|nr:S8 family serine peptidase [Bacteroidales bacterium]